MPQGLFVSQPSACEIAAGMAALGEEGVAGCGPASSVLRTMVVRLVPVPRSAGKSSPCETTAGRGSLLPGRKRYPSLQCFSDIRSCGNSALPPCMIWPTAFTDSWPTAETEGDKATPDRQTGMEGMCTEGAIVCVWLKLLLYCLSPSQCPSAILCLPLCRSAHAVFAGGCVCMCAPVESTQQLTKKRGYLSVEFKRISADDLQLSLVVFFFLGFLAVQYSICWTN